MRLGVGPRSEHALLFASKKHEANRAARDRSRCMDHPRGINHHRGIASVVERARSKLPRIKMRAENHKILGILAAENFGNYVFRVDRARDLVRHVEIDADRDFFREKPRYPFGVLARDHRLRHLLERPVE